MFVSKLILSTFRNIKNLNINLFPGITLVLGNNGQGKTNLLESIYTLSVTKSFRTNKTNNVIMLGQEVASIYGKINDAKGFFDLSISIKNKEKEVYINQNRIKSLTEYLSKLTVVLFSPSDISTITGSPAGRRRFIDKHLMDISTTHVNHIIEYQKALLNKSILIKQPHQDLNSLSPWNNILSRAAFKILKERERFIEKLQEVGREKLDAIARTDGELTLTLKTNTPLVENEEELFEFFQNQRLKELNSHFCIFGPHKDDLLIKIGGLDIRNFASQGQVRSVILALKFGIIDILEEKKEDPPVILLDDVDSELDKERRDRLIKNLFHENRQIIATTTNSQSLSVYSNSILTMKSGDVN